MAKDSDGLTILQRKFVNAFPLATSATEAAIKAGYSNVANGAEVMASENLRKPIIKAALSAQNEAAASAAIATLRERKERMSEFLRKPVPEGPVAPQVIIAASDQLNRMERVYGDPVVKEGDTHNTLVLQGFSVEELRRLLAKMDAGEEEGDGA